MKQLTWQSRAALPFPTTQRSSTLTRSDPAVVALLEDEDARSEIYPESDVKLAQALRDLGQIGSGEFFYVNGWDEYEDERIRSFLAENPPTSAS